MVWTIVERIVRWALDWLTDEDRRRRKRRLRAAKLRLHREQLKVRELMRQRVVERWKREHTRRGALIRYREAQLDLVCECIEILEAAKKAGFSKLKPVEKRIKEVAASTHLSPRALRAFHGRKDALHRAIAESKKLTESLHAEKRKLIGELKQLQDANTHRKLGAKLKIRALLGELEEGARTRLREPELDFEYVRFELAERCPECRVHLAATFATCPMCGHARDGIVLQRYFKKDAGKAALTCGECYAPSDQGFAHCFNCGAVQDAFGLRAALEA